MKSRRPYQRRRQIADINVTPFVDVMLVLLIVFMATAPLLSVGISVDLPESEAETLPQSEDVPLTLTIDADGGIYLQDVVISRDELRPQLQALLSERRDGRIYFRADEANAYGAVLDVMGLVSVAGFNDIVFVTEATEGAGNGAGG